MTIIMMAVILTMLVMIIVMITLNYNDADYRR